MFRSASEGTITRSSRGNAGRAVRYSRHCEPSLVDEGATHRLLHGLLLKRDIGEDQLTRRPGANGVPRRSLIRPASRGARLAPLEQRKSSLNELQVEAARNAFLREVCPGHMRFDVKDWIRKVYDLQQEAARIAAIDEEVDTGKCSRSKACPSDGRGMDQGLTAGGSSASAAGQSSLQSVAGDLESIAVHHGGSDPLLSFSEKVQAFIAGNTPELERHVETEVAKHVRELKKKAEDKLAGRFLNKAKEQDVFGAQANHLRWHNARHQFFQLELDKNMPDWIMEAIETWDQKRSMQSTKKKIQSEDDLVFSYLTKRAAHINIDNLPSEIPIFKTQRMSYLLPAMWKDGSVVEHS